MPKRRNSTRIGAAVRNGRSLPHAVADTYGSLRCPCCGMVMSHRTVRRFKATPADKATVGHDVAVARGGHPGVWFWMCSRCNNEQGVLDLVTWARKLVYDGDPRAERVTGVAKFVRGWVAGLLEEENRT